MNQREEGDPSVSDLYVLQGMMEVVPSSYIKILFDEVT